MTPLSQACTNGSAAFVRLLLKSGANPNTAHRHRRNSAHDLRKERQRGRGDASWSSTAPRSTRRSRPQNQTALMWAAAEHQLNVVRRSSTPMRISKPTAKQGFTAIHFAARQGDLERVKLLLAAGVDVNILTQADQRRRLPLPGLYRRGRLGERRPPGQGYTPLLVATMRAQVDLALYLLDHGADPNIGAAGFTPLHWASTTWENYAANPVYGFEDPMSGIPDRQAKLRLVKALLAHGANVNARMTKPQPSVRQRIRGRRGRDAFPARRFGRRRGDDAHSARRPAPIPKSPPPPMRPPSWPRQV